MPASGSPMRDFLARHREGLVLVILLTASLLLISHQVKDNTGTSFLKRGAITVISPFQAAASGAVNGLNGLWNNYLYLFGVRSENKALKEDIHRLQGEIQELREELYRAGRMEEFQQYREATGIKGVAARVIGASPDPWTHMITINRGRGDGVGNGMPVVTPEGLVGRVTEAAASSSIVRLIVDRASHVPVLIRRSRGQAILEGENSITCQLKYLDRTEDVREGDMVITSGLAGIYPRGIEVGTISQITRGNYGLYQYAKLLPKNSLGRLEDVLVITEVEDLKDIK